MAASAYYVIVVKGRGGMHYLHRAPHNAVTLVDDRDSATKFGYADAVSLANTYKGLAWPCN
jgi:hypothetical protein